MVLAIFKVLPSTGRPRGVEIDLVIVTDEQTSSSDFVRLAQLAAGAGKLLASVDCVSLDERSATLWAAVRESHFLAGRVRSSAAWAAAADEALSRAVEGGSGRIIAVSELHDTDLWRLLLAASAARENDVISLGAFPVEGRGGIGLVIPRAKWSLPDSSIAAREARALIETLGGHLLGLAPAATYPELTKIWVVGARPDHTIYAEMQPGSPPVLTVVVPTLDAASGRCGRLLASLRQNTCVPYQVVLVDNGNAPQGYTAPVNTALLAAQTEYVAAINDDVEVQDGWWEPLQAALDAGHALAFPETVGNDRPPYFAWCFAMRRATVEALSRPRGDFFDPTFSVWYQDTDLFLRLKALGETPHHVPASRISHTESATIATDDPVLKPWIRQQIEIDRARFVEKWGEGILPENRVAGASGGQ